RALDLHVLGVPPAFVLSQDQTLRFKIPSRSLAFSQKAQRQPELPRNQPKTPLSQPQGAAPSRRPRFPSPLSPVKERRGRPTTEPGSAHIGGTEPRVNRFIPRWPRRRPSPDAKLNGTPVLLASQARSRRLSTTLQRYPRDTQQP